MTTPPASVPAAPNRRPPSRLDRWLAAVCAQCPVCRRARKRGAGLAFRIVQVAERRFCPFCRAFERVHGVPAHGGRSG